MARIDVVIADQHHLVRAGFSLILQSLDGVNVAEADSVDGAVELVAKHRPRLVLISVKLGERSGFELTRRIRQLGEPQPRILIMVGSRDGDVAELVTRSGADGTVAKYATPEEIVASVRGAVAA
ncbi:response regulator transcription factor [uncultured Gulosibacter sp.]|uniref:response regulator n=1 Tax=uncultured Gulosibacter sp. TaxID=1339167 RepID=UPI0028892EA2|nr:response regulator transcription factor [uncultured Gulosibacter sp.]